MRFFLLLISLLFVLDAKADLSDDMSRLQRAYPDQIKTASSQAIEWEDGTLMRNAQIPGRSDEEKFLHPTLVDQVEDVVYPAGIQASPPASDPGRIRYEPFFRKMYGETAAEVEKNLVTIYWMPTIFGNRFPLRVTKINGVDKRLQLISQELENLSFTAFPYLENPDAYRWRYIANTQQLSMHSFGIAVDINIANTHYWQWDLKKQNREIKEDAELTYPTPIPWEIVLIFEKYGFIWGGKWHHYDTMHFEYRPELLVNQTNPLNETSNLFVIPAGRHTEKAI